MQKQIFKAGRIWILELAALLTLALALSTCSESPTEPLEVFQGRFEEYIYLDTTKFYRVSRQFDTISPRTYAEPHILHEQSLGEPFADNDSDGVFGLGDGFFICVCPENQDLNRNTRYDSPDIRNWSRGVPFDDINGNGTLDRMDIETCCYVPGIPFVDYNGNGVYDSSVTEINNIYLPVMRNSIYGDFLNLTTGTYPDNLTPAYEFISDSGAIYSLHGTLYGTILSKIRVADSGITLFLAERTFIKLLDSGMIDLVSNDSLSLGVFGYFFFDRVHFNLSVEHFDTLSVRGRELVDVITVSLFRATPDERTLEINDVRLYFAKGLGLAGFAYTIADGASIVTFLDERFTLDQLPLPMTR